MCIRDRVDTLKLLDGVVDIYLTDFKYMDVEAAERYSHAPDYPEVCLLYTSHDP